MLFNIKNNHKIIITLSIVASSLFFSGCGSDASVTADSQGSNIVAISQTEEVKSDKNATAFGIKFGDLTETEVTEMLTQKKESIENQEITFVFESERFDFSLSDFGITVDIPNTIINIMSNKNQGVFSYDEDSLDRVFTELEKAKNLEPVNANMTRTNGEFIITDGVAGKVIDRDILSEHLFDAIDSGVLSDIVIPFKNVEPEYTREIFENSTDLLGSATSKYSVGSTPRNQNLTTASNGINGSIIFPGEIFSTNSAFKSRTVANGYASAPVISNGVLVDDIGGGICQISSTLYNTVIKSELEIVERRNHSIKVGYMGYAYDATLAEGSIDFRFANNTDYPIYIESTLSGGIAKVDIYGNETRDVNRTIKFRNAFVSSSPAGETIKEDSSLPAGEKVYDVKPLDGVTYNLYKDIYINGVLTDTELVNTSVYRVRNSVVRVGTGEVKETETPQVETEAVKENTEDIIDDTTPVIDDITPVVEDVEPSVEETIPTDEPGVVTSIPTSDSVENTDDSLPFIEDIPVVEEDIPVVEETIPTIEDNVDEDLPVIE